MSAKDDGWELIGSAPVDAGLIWVGDPCYILPCRRYAEIDRKTLAGEYGEEIRRQYVEFNGETPPSNGLDYDDMLDSSGMGSFEYKPWGQPGGRPGTCQGFSPGFVFGTYYGDGEMPVYIKSDADGRPTHIMVDLTGGDGGDEEEDEHEG